MQKFFSILGTKIIFECDFDKDECNSELKSDGSLLNFARTEANVIGSYSVTDVSSISFFYRLDLMRLTEFKKYFFLLSKTSRKWSLLCYSFHIH